MKKLIGSLAILPLLTVGVVAGSGSAQAGLLTPPPPNSTASFAPFLITGNQAGARAFIRNSASSPTGRVFILDFLPYVDVPQPLLPNPNVGVPYNGPLGTINNSQWGAVGIGTADTNPPGGVSIFDSVVGNIGLLADVLLPYAGVPFNGVLNFALATPVPLLDFSNPLFTPATPPPITATLSPTNSVDTFTATILQSVRATNLSGSGSSIEIVFDGYWNIQNPNTGLLEKYEGLVTLSQVLTNTIQQLEAGALTNNGITRSFNGSTDVAHTPEPSALGSLAAAVVLGAASLLRKRQKQQ